MRAKVTNSRGYTDTGTAAALVGSKTGDESRRD